MKRILGPATMVKPWISTLLVCISLAGCFRNRVITACDPDSGTSCKRASITFSGIKSTDINTHVKVLIVHGIGEDAVNPDSSQYSSGSLYSHPLIAGLQKTLGLTPCKAGLVPQCLNKVVKIERPHNDLCAPNCGNYGFVQEDDYLSGRVRYTFYTLVWANLTAPFKMAFLGSDEADRGHRDVFNQRIKAQLIDHGLSDAVLFAGSFRDRMEHSVRQAMCIVLT